MRSPAADARFALYFSREWSETLGLSTRNLLSSAFATLPPPLVTSLSESRKTAKSLELRCAALQSELDALRALNKPPSPPPPSPPPASPGPAQSPAPPSQLPPAAPVPITPSRPSPSPFPPLEPSDSPVNAPFGSLVLSSPAATPSPPDSVRVFSGHSSPVNLCRCAPDGGSVAAASSDGTVRIWSPDIPQAPASGGRAPISRAATLYCGSQLAAMAWEPRASRLLLLGTRSGLVRAWDTEAQRIVCQAAAAASALPILALAASPTDGSFAVATSAGAALWALRGFAAACALAETGGTCAVRSVAYSRDGRLLAASCDDRMLRVFDVAARGSPSSRDASVAPLGRWPAGGGCALQFAADGSHVLALGEDGFLTAWALDDERAWLWRTRALPDAEKADESFGRPELAVHPGGAWALACGGGCAAVVPLGGEGGGCLDLAAGHAGAVHSVDWHPAGGWALSGGADGSVRLVSVADLL